MINRSLLMSLACLALAACAEDDAPDFCRNHALFHSEHAASNATLSVTMTEDGHIESELRIPLVAVRDNSISALLQDVGKVYALQSAVVCSAAEVDVQSGVADIVALYSSDCGVGNKLGQIDVLLFDLLPELNEVDVLVVTPATQKHFAINRQCERAIFRLK